MFFRPSDSQSISQFRLLFWTSLESLRAKIVDLHNSIVNVKENLEAEASPKIPVNSATKMPAVDYSIPASQIVELIQFMSMQLLEGENNFVNRLENMKRDVSHSPNINAREMVKKNSDLIIELTALLTIRLDEKFDDKIKKPITEILQKGIVEINKNVPVIEGSQFKIAVTEVRQEGPAPLSANRRSKL